MSISQRVATPALPNRSRNQLLDTFDPYSVQVKYQSIKRGNEEVLVGRMKVPLPGTHAFVLRRFDTGAVSVTTILKAAYPNLPEDEEKELTQWVRSAFELSGANGSGARRLAGVWAPLDVALHLASEFGIPNILGPLVDASPTEDDKERGASVGSNVLLGGPKRSSSTTPTSNAAARRGKSPASTVGGSPQSTTKRRRQESPARATRTSSRLSASPAPRSLRSSVSPSRQTGRRSTVATRPKASAFEEEATDNEEEDGRAVDRDEAIASSKEVVANIMAAAQESNAVVTGVSVKRGRNTKGGEEATTELTLNIATPGAAGSSGGLEVARPIATNRRVLGTPARKAAAWGALAFSIGLGAAAFVPNFL